jgi:epoxide hydrolase
MKEDEFAVMARLQWFHENVARSTNPESTTADAGHTLTDPPAGLLRWNGQLFGGSVDIGFVPIAMASCWFTAASASSARSYYENAHMDAPIEPTTVSIGLASFVGDFRFVR